jgi:hypothetical protein
MSAPDRVKTTDKTTEMFRLDEKVAIVTGAPRLLGEHIATLHSMRFIFKT